MHELNKRKNSWISWYHTWYLYGIKSLKNWL